MKTCNHCNKEKELSEFHKSKNNPDGLTYTCKLCRNREQSDLRMFKYNTDLQYRQKTNQYNNEAQRKRNLKNPLYKINQSLKSRYGITLKEYNEKFIHQKGLCKICNKSETQLDLNGNIKRLHVDHNHKTGKVRGLLCSECNTGIGKFKDDISLLEKVIEYLKSNS